MRPTCEITIDGRPASSTLVARVISCEVIDKEGLASDTVSIELLDDPPAAIPRMGAIIGVSMGYVGRMAFMGEFEAEEVEVRVLPNTMRIVGKAAGMRSEGKSTRERHWDNKSVADIVSQIAGEHGLTSAVDERVGTHVYPWVGQVGESDWAFLDRLAGRLNAIFSVKGGLLIFAARGSGESPAGSQLTPVIVTPAILKPDSISVRFADRARFKEVIAVWMDRGGGKKQEVKVTSDSEGEGEYRIGEQFADEDEARLAAEAKARELLRRQCGFDCEVVGDPAARGGAPLQFVGCRPGIDGMEFIIDTARHSFSKSGYTTTLSGKQKG